MYTQEPWEVRSQYGHDIVQPGGRIFETVAHWVHPVSHLMQGYHIKNGMDGKEQEAKRVARLISAAPDMLRALKSVVLCYEKGSMLTARELNEVQEAIHKAT